MSGIISRTNFDCSPMSIVPVIASFASDGHITPLYVRINGTSYKIDKHRMSAKFINTMEFECQIIDGEYIKPLKLTFFHAEGKWTMPKQNRL